LQRSCARKPVFFVATALLRGALHINLTSKAIGLLRIPSPNRAAYLDQNTGGTTPSPWSENLGQRCAPVSAIQVIVLADITRVDLVQL
jgi:hypothetical protein